MNDDHQNDEARHAPGNTPPIPAVPDEPQSNDIDIPPQRPAGTDTFLRIEEQIKRVVLGQDEVIRQVLAGWLAGGHVLLEGKPGLGKTQLVLAMAKCFGGAFSRIQFTPDLMPADVTGFRLFDMKSQSFQLRRGPVFTNLLLADEINRAPAKTQAALLEVMQERQVTIDGETLKLEPPFMTLATQNPIEHEGTYPLPEAQLDRFLMKIIIDYPQAEAEGSIVAMAASEAPDQQIIDDLTPVATPREIIMAQAEAAEVRAVPEVIDYAVRIVKATRESKAIALGAGTRGAIALIKIGKANAMLDGRDFVMPADVKAAALPILRHRLQLAPEALISGQNLEQVLRTLLESVAAPRQ